MTILGLFAICAMFTGGWIWTFRHGIDLAGAAVAAALFLPPAIVAGFSLLPRQAQDALSEGLIEILAPAAFLSLAFGAGALPALLHRAVLTLWANKGRS